MSFPVLCSDDIVLYFMKLVLASSAGVVVVWSAGPFTDVTSTDDSLAKLESFRITSTSLFESNVSYLFMAVQLCGAPLAERRLFTCLICQRPRSRRCSPTVMYPLTRNAQYLGLDIMCFKDCISFHQRFCISVREICYFKLD